MAGNARDLALFNMADDSKMRGCDLVRVRDVFAAGRVKERASMIQSKTGKPVRFEITETTRLSLERWIQDPEMIGLEFLWPSRIHGGPHLSTRQYARIVRGWVTSVGLEPSAFGTHSMRRTKMAQIYKKTGNLRAVQLLLGHTKMDSTVRYLGVDIEDAMTLSEGIDMPRSGQLLQTVAITSVCPAKAVCPFASCWTAASVALLSICVPTQHPFERPEREACPPDRQHRDQRGGLARKSERRNRRYRHR